MYAQKSYYYSILTRHWLVARARARSLLPCAICSRLVCSRAHAINNNEQFVCKSVVCDDYAPQCTCRSWCTYRPYSNGPLCADGLRTSANIGSKVCPSPHYESAQVRKVLIGRMFTRVSAIDFANTDTIFTSLQPFCGRVIPGSFDPKLRAMLNMGRPARCAEHLVFLLFLLDHVCVCGCVCYVCERERESAITYRLNGLNGVDSEALSWEPLAGALLDMWTIPFNIP